MKEKTLQELETYAKDLYVFATGDRNVKDMYEIRQFLEKNEWLIEVWSYYGKPDKDHYYKTGEVIHPRYWNGYIHFVNQDKYNVHNRIGYYQIRLAHGKDDGTIDLGESFMWQFENSYSAIVHTVVMAMELYLLYITVDKDYNREIGEKEDESLLDIYNLETKPNDADEELKNQGFKNTPVKFLITREFTRDNPKKYVEHIKKTIKEVREWRKQAVVV